MNQPSTQSQQDRDFEAAHAIGKIYQSLTDKKALCDFFIESALSFINASSGYLFLAGREDQLWLESSTDGQEAPEVVKEDLSAIFQTGKPQKNDTKVYVPLIVRNSAMGIAVFVKDSGDAFSERDLELASDLAAQLAGSLKNILLFEQNLNMERLATIGKSMGMVMHEIKNILQLATFADEWLTKGVKNNDEKKLNRGLDTMKKALREMNGFIYEVLSLTKDYKISPVKVNIEGLLSELGTDLEEKASSCNVKFSCEVESDMSVVDAEERSLYRAVLNLVKNAMEACDKPESWVKVKAASLDDNYYQIRVEDNGQGMTDEVKAKIRQAFFSTKGESGTGLGVMIVEKTLQAHQGKMDIESEFGKGTSFILTLPKEIKAEA